MGRSWGVLKRSLGVMGQSRLSCGGLGVVLDSFGVVLGPAWGGPGVVLGRHGAVLERLGAGERTGRRARRAEEWHVHEMVLFARIWHTQ